MIYSSYSYTYPNSYSYSFFIKNRVDDFILVNSVPGVYDIKPLKGPYITPEFKDWFIGFAEGDGSLSCDLNARRLIFKIRQKDAKVLYYIKNSFGFGSVSQDLDTYFTYTVTSKRNILVLINLFNGNLVLTKTNQRFVSEWLNNYNTWFAASNPIDYKKPAPFVGLQSAWLCGFTDADGSFGFKIAADKSRKYGCRVRIYWYIDQSFALQDLQYMLLVLTMQASQPPLDHELCSVDLSLEDFTQRTLLRSKDLTRAQGNGATEAKKCSEQNKLVSVTNFGFIEAKVLTESSFKPSAPEQAHRFIVMSHKSCMLLCRYYEQYPLITTNKKVRFMRWKRVLNWCLNGVWFEHLNEIKHLIGLNKKL